jgi:hypothetical protein
MTPLTLPYSFPINDDQFVKSDSLKQTWLSTIRATDPMQVNSYAELTDMVAKLAFFNRGHVLFFRGQPEEYCLGSEYPTIYPTMFRKIIKGEATKKKLEETLDVEEEILKIKNHHRKPRFHGAKSILESDHIRWALLQHYEICDTPLIDVTQSLHVAASFAIKNKPKTKDAKGIIYVVALPWPSKNYHSNKEEGLYLVRLAGITPPQAKRPYRQEAYAAMSINVDKKPIDNIDVYDLTNRLVCKFEINNSPEFWSDAIKPLPESFLAPKEDVFYKFMKEDPKINDINSFR